MVAWGIALMTACAAVAGSLVTGWYTRVSGSRQADAVLETVRMTLQDQRSVRLFDLRRGVYAEFLAAAEVLVQTRRTRVGDPSDQPALRRAFAAVLLEGPADTASAARGLVDLLGTGRGSMDEIELRREAFIATAQQALRSGAPS
jgi:hypothetical protein